MNIHWLTILGIIMIGLGTLFTFLGQQIISDRSSGKIEKLSKENIKLNNELSDLNKEIVKSVIGGDSFCYLVIGSINSETNAGLLTVVHQGEHPIYDVNARMVDLQEFKKLDGKLNSYNFSQADTNIQIGNMIKNTASTFRPFNLGTSARRDFNIFFSARNGLFTQLLRMRKVDGKWLYATKVQKQDKVIFEKIDDKFPRNDIGEIEWQ